MAVTRRGSIVAGAAAAFAVILGHHLGQAFFLRTAVGGLGGGGRELKALQQGRRAPSSRSNVVRKRWDLMYTSRSRPPVFLVFLEAGGRGGRWRCSEVGSGGGCTCRLVNDCASVGQVVIMFGDKGRGRRSTRIVAV